MKIRTLSILALAAIAAVGCKKSDTSEGATTSDTTTVPGTDTVSQTVNTVVPTTDSVVQTTTTDTIHGDASDSMAHDTTKKM